MVSRVKHFALVANISFFYYELLIWHWCNSSMIISNCLYLEFEQWVSILKRVLYSGIKMHLKMYSKWRKLIKNGVDISITRVVILIMMWRAWIVCYIWSKGMNRFFGCCIVVHEGFDPLNIFVKKIINCRIVKRGFNWEEIARE